MDRVQLIKRAGLIATLSVCLVLPATAQVRVNGSTATTGSGGGSSGDVNITQVGGATISGTNPVPTRATTASGFVCDDVADDAVSACNPVPIGTLVDVDISALTVLSDGDRAYARSDSDGFIYMRPWSKGDVIAANVTNTDGTATALFAAIANVKNVITSIQCNNTSASTNAYVEIKDNTTVKATIPCPPLSLGGGSILTLPTPLIGTTNTAWNFDPSTAVTTITISAQGYKVR